MRSIVSHGIIVTFIGKIAEYSNLARETAHRLHVEWLLPEWVNDYPLVLNIAFAIVCLPIVSHAIPVIARLVIALCTGILKLHAAIGTFWLTLCKRVEQKLLDWLKAGLWKILTKIEDLTSRIKDDGKD